MTKRQISFVLGLLMTIGMKAQGWPEQYTGVMLQGFYWDSYNDTQWTVLESQADELARYFDLIWVPNSAYANDLSNNMGYHPVYWFDHKSAFGTEDQLRSMISTFKEKGLGVIEDVVINHRASVNSNWLNFPREIYKDVEYQLTAADICRDDESKDNGYTPTGSKDTGEGWGGARDLDHTSKNVQKNVLAYEDKLLNDLGYVGFRYDFVKGFHGSYVGLYNKTVQPKFSVGECWDGNKTVVTNWLNATKQDNVIQSAAFDFILKYYINDAFTKNQWNRLNGGCLADDNNYKRYGVTFIDNHDTGRWGECPLSENIEAANAYILTMPGTPCLWLTHWKAYKNTLKKLICIRKAAGIHNQSTILSKSDTSTGYVLKVQGLNGSVLLLLGNATASTDGFKPAMEGKGYRVYVSEAVDISSLEGIGNEDTFSIPSFCTVGKGEICAFFEIPASYSNIRCWAWNDKSNFTAGAWPGAACSYIGMNNNNKVYKWTWNGKAYRPNTTIEMYPEGMPANIIFNNGEKKTSDLVFFNGGYYVEQGTLRGVVAETTGIESLTYDPFSMETPHSACQGKGEWCGYYTLDGRKLQNNPSQCHTLEESPVKGVYIRGGKKYAVK